MTRKFFDTNILVYTYDNDYPSKQERARTLVNEYELGDVRILSTQVLQEFVWTSTRRLKPRLSFSEAHDAVVELAKLVVVQIDIPLVLSAIKRAEQTGFSYWDSLIVNAAMTADAEVLFTEDLNHGQIIDGVLRIENPFRDL